MSRVIPVKISGRIDTVSESLWAVLQGPIPPDWYRLQGSSNGCSFSPDQWDSPALLGGRPRTYKLWPACFFHDWHYRSGVLGRSGEGRRQADLFLRANIRGMVVAQRGPADLAEEVADLYWGRVRLWASAHYAGGDYQDFSLGTRLAEVYGHHD